MRRNPNGLIPKLLSRDTTTVAAKASGVLESLVVSVAMGSIGYDLEKSLVRCHPAFVWNFYCSGPRRLLLHRYQYNFDGGCLWGHHLMVASFLVYGRTGVQRVMLANVTSFTLYGTTVGVWYNWRSNWMSLILVGEVGSNDLPCYGCYECPSLFGLYAVYDLPWINISCKIRSMS